MEKTYLISEDELLQLLEDSARLEALSCGGVDNWSYYSEALQDYVSSFAEEEENNDNYWFEDIAKKDLENYQKAIDIR